MDVFLHPVVELVGVHLYVGGCVLVPGSGQVSVDVSRVGEEEGKVSSHYGELGG